MKQNIRVSMTTTSSSQILFEGVVQINNRCFQYYETGTNALTIIEWYRDGLTVTRQAEDTTILHLSEKDTRLTIVTKEGTLEIPNVQFLSFRQTEKEIEVFYNVDEKRCIQIKMME